MRNKHIDEQGDLHYWQTYENNPLQEPTGENFYKTKEASSDWNEFDVDKQEGDLFSSKKVNLN